MTRGYWAVTFDLSKYYHESEKIAIDKAAKQEKSHLSAVIYNSELEIYSHSMNDSIYSFYNNFQTQYTAYFFFVFCIFFVVFGLFVDKI